VLLVDDNGLFRDGIAEILRADGRFEVIGQASRGDEAVTAASRLRPDLILMDLRMPGMTGLEAIRRIRAQDPAVPIGVLTMFETSASVQSALGAGATGYVIKDSTPSELCEAAAALAQGQRDLVANPRLQSPGASGPASGLLAQLTARQVEVLRALATGASQGAIARSLGISPKTLRNHISDTYRKLGINDRAQAVIVAIREGLVEVGSP
jgi:DNA-binding NarL/FixJ family response regulator